jgi:formylglycine-generating enzyme required for sulfatase activity
MIVVRAGKFMMGSPKTEKNSETKKYSEDIEYPQHKVSIHRDFAVSKYSVTFADWDVCLSVGGCPPITDSDWGRDKWPVINLTWDEAEKYARWLSRMTGRPYRLLTEAEWEYSARAGTTTDYYWGDEIGEGNARCQACGGQWDRGTSPVGTFNPNPFGLYDMAGNVWQWVEDCYHDDYKDAPKDGSAWTSGNCNSRVARGGSWGTRPENLRSADRFGNSAGTELARRFTFGQNVKSLIFTSLTLGPGRSPDPVFLERS